MMRDRFDAVVSSVDIVAHEKVICVRRLAANAEKLHKVVELTVHVAAYSHRAFHLSDGRQNIIFALDNVSVIFLSLNLISMFHLLDVTLLAQDLLCFFTEGFHLGISILGFTALRWNLIHKKVFR